MKYFLTAIILIFISSFLSAQNFTIEVNDTILYGSSYSSDFYGDIDLNNETASFLSMRWELLSSTLPDEWEISICDPIVCSPVGVESRNFNLPVNSSNNVINIHFYPHNVQGNGMALIKVFELSNPDEAQILSFTGSTTDGIKFSLNDTLIQVNANFINDSISLNTEITNTSNADLNIQWEIQSLNLPYGWDAKICDSQNCYGSTLNSSEFNLVNDPGITKQLGVRFLSNGNDYGTGEIIINYFEKNTNDFLTITYIATFDITDIKEIPEDFNYLSCFPNPAQGNIEINYHFDNFSGQSSLHLIDIMGKEIFQNEIKNQNGLLNINNLQAGTYFCFIKDAEKVQAIEKLIIY